MVSKSEKSIKWWLRYVVCGSGGIVALIIALISLPNFFKQPNSSQISVKQGIVGNKISTRNGSVFIVNGNIKTEQQDDVKTYIPPRVSEHKTIVSTAYVREILGRRNFFELDYGTLSVLPNVRTHSSAINSDVFWVLEPGKQNIIKVLSVPLWLQFNHYLPDSDGKRRHLGILVVTFGKMGATMPLEVYRNKKWMRPQDKKILNQFSEVVDLSWADFLTLTEKWSYPDAKIIEADQVVKGPWHAIPQGGDKFSWSYREFWKWAAVSCQNTADSVFGGALNFNNVKVSARLIGYTPTPQPSSKSPVIFDVRSLQEEASSIFIAIYGLEDSGQDIRKWYWITWER